MKKIEHYEKVAKREIEKPDSWKMYHAYMASRENGNKYLNFHDVIWEKEIPEIVKACREHGIDRFTVSCPFSSLLETLELFEKEGCKVGDLTRVNAPYKKRDWDTGESEWDTAAAITVKVN